MASTTVAVAKAEDPPTYTISEVNGEYAEPKKFVFRNDFAVHTSCTGSMTQLATEPVVDATPVTRPPTYTLLAAVMAVIEVTVSHANAYSVFTSPVM